MSKKCEFNREWTEKIENIARYTALEVLAEHIKKEHEEE